MNNSPNLQPSPREVENEAQPLLGGFEIGQHLCHVEIVDVIERLRLKHHLILNKKIETLRAHQSPLVFDGNRDLPAEGNVVGLQFLLQRFGIDLFYETRP